MTLTDHAKRRAEERGCPYSLLDGVVKHGTKKPAYRGRVMHCFQKLRVITEGNNIITLWRD